MKNITREEKRNRSGRWGRVIAKADGSRRSAGRAMVLLGVLLAANGYAQQSSLLGQIPRFNTAVLTVDGSAPALAFAKYLASLQERNPFTEAGPIDIEIEASLPGLGKYGNMRAFRQTGVPERSEYSAITFEGDPAVRRQVIARYLAAQEQAEALPYSSVAVTPANYKFRYAGSVQDNGAVICVFQIAPKQKRHGLIRGHIWIDSGTGIAIRQAGSFVKRPSVFIRKIEVTRDTNLQDGIPYTRVTHVSIETRLAGRAELTITEGAVQAVDSEIGQQLITQRGMR
jgi:hypothetical protein